jgi:hypothetical protein
VERVGKGERTVCRREKWEVWGGIADGRSDGRKGMEVDDTGGRGGRRQRETTREQQKITVMVRVRGGEGI